MLFEINGGRHVPLRDDAVVFSVATEAHPPRQFEVQFRLRAKVMSVLHAPAPVVCVFDLGEQDAARLPLLTCDGEQCGSGGCGAGYSPGSLGHAFKQTHSRPYGSRHSREFMMTRQWEVEMRFAVSLHEKIDAQNKVDLSDPFFFRGRSRTTPGYPFSGTSGSPV